MTDCYVNFLGGHNMNDISCSLKGSDSHMMNVHVTYQKDVFNVTSFPDSLFMKNISKLL